MEKWKAEKRFPLSHSHDGYDDEKKIFADGCKENPASSLILCPTNCHHPSGPPQIERPGFESPFLCHKHE